MVVYFDHPFLHVPPTGRPYLRFLECLMTERRDGYGLWDEQVYCVSDSSLPFYLHARL
jgi:hypothetical protein